MAAQTTPEQEVPAPARPLFNLCRELHALGGAADVLAWDQEVMMPLQGLEARAAQLELLARLQHERLVSDRFGEALDRADEGAGEDPDWGPNVRELRRQREQALAIPSDLVARSARTHSLAQAAWAEARAGSDFTRFAPSLTQVLELARERAAALRSGADPDKRWNEDWDALADGYEPGIRAVELEQLFASLVPRIVPLVERCAAQPQPDGAELRDRVVPIAAQEALVREVAVALGFDLTRGRIDRSTHPFCSGTCPEDVRLTTRFLEHDFLDGLGSTMHEVGHALYEQGLPSAFAGTPRGQAASLGLHESQSRLWENHVGRGRAFWQWAAPRARAAFGDAIGNAEGDRLFRAANRVQPSLIRVEADEVTYDLHVALRFDLERALIRGDLSVADLPAAWNDGMKQRLGIDVPDDARGCLQDVHWSCGLVGYFPTYTLGNVYAAELFAKAQEELGGADALDSLIAAGEFTPLRDWLRANVHRHGTSKPAAQLVADVLGRPANADNMVRHLTARVDAAYSAT